jgi:hypothetical protein
LQSTLPGYRERIAHVALRPEDGGLNLAMDQQTILKLTGYGEQAGELLRDRIDFDAHRWRRFLVAMAKMEETWTMSPRPMAIHPANRLPPSWRAIPAPSFPTPSLRRSRRNVEAWRGTGGSRTSLARRAHDT